MELHGAGNDLDIIPQAAAKGVRWLKMDVSFATRSACESFSTFGQPGKGTEADCFVDSLGRELCCVALRGDASSRPFLPSPFNTSYDLLDLVDDYHSAWWLNDAQQPFHLGLDFGMPNGTYSILDRNQTNLIWGLLLGLQERIARYNISLQPYFDSTMNGWFQDLDQLCGADGGNCNEVLALLDSIPWPSETGGGFPPLSQDPRGRFQILNSDWQSFESVCAGGWNDSIGTGRLLAPPMWWEPSSQIEYWAMFKAQQECKTFPAGHEWMASDLNDGLTVVTNQGPEMFEVYSSPFGINRGLNALFAPSSLYTNPKMALLARAPSSTSASKYDRFALIAAQRKVDGDYDLLSVGIIDGTAPSIGADVIANITTTATNIKAGALVSVAAYDVAISSPASIAAAAAASASSLVLLADSFGDLTAVAVNPNNGSARVALVSSFPLVAPYFAEGSTLLAAYPLCLGSNGTSCVVVALAQNGSVTTAGGGQVVLASATLSAGMGRFLGASSSSLFATLAADKGASLALLPSSAASSLSSSLTFEGLAVISSTVSHGVTSGAASLTEGGGQQPAAVDALLQEIASEACEHPNDLARRKCDKEALKRLWREKLGSSSKEGLLKAGEQLSFSRGELFGVPLQVTFNTAVAAKVVDMDSVTFEVSVVGEADGTTRRIGIGSAPHVSVMRSVASPSAPAAPMAFLTYTDGQCQNGLIMNNADTSKCLIPLPASDDDLLLNFFQSVPYLLNYAYGSLDAWASTLSTSAAPASGRAAYNAYISMCNTEGLHHGKFDCGYSPSAGLYHRSVVYANATEAPNGAAPELAALVLHDGSVLCPLQTTVICGSPLPHDGLTLDNFRLVQQGFM